jgi:hypothetical protein
MICEEGDAPEAVNKTIVEGDRLTGKRLGHVPVCAPENGHNVLVVDLFCKGTSHIPFSTFIYYYLLRSFSPFTAIITGCTLLFKQ